MRFRNRWLAPAAICLAAGCAPESPPPAGGAQAGAASPALENGSFTAPLNGFDIHYEVHGTGPVLMTLPNSWGLSLEGLRALYRPLEQQLTLVYFDPRGISRSGPIREEADMGMAAVRADFDALRRHLGLERVNAIGWSNGAMNLILLAAEHPQTLSSAIFLHGTASFSQEDMEQAQAEHAGLFQQFATFRERLSTRELSPEEKSARVKQFVIEIWFPHLFADPDAGRKMLREIYRDTDFSWPHHLHADVDAQGFDARDRLAAIQAPALVIAGAHDMVPPDKVEALDRGIPSSRFVVFENSGHFAPIEEPEAFVATVLEFLGVARS